jgi:pentatricopeptide repeat protein
MATRAELETRRDTHAERLRSPELQGDEHKRVRKRIMAKLGKINKALGELDEAFSAAAAASAACTKRGAAGSPASSAASAASASVSAAAADGDSSAAGGGKRAKLGNKVDKLKRKKKILFINKRLKLLAQRKHLKDARDVFAKAERKGLVDKHTFANIINANVRCGNMGGVDGAAALVSRMPAAGLAADVVVYTTLIKGYCNAGDIRSAVGVLLSMVRTKHVATGAQRGQTLLPTVSGNWLRSCACTRTPRTHAHHAHTSTHTSTHSHAAGRIHCSEISDVADCGCILSHLSNA